MFFVSDSDEGEEDTPKASSSSKVIPIQSGTGLSDSFIDKLGDIVTEKLSKKFNLKPAVHPNWPAYESAVPTVTSDVKIEDSIPSPSFGFSILRNELNDKFDQQHLISLVPRFYKQKANTLLSIIEERPSEINFDSKGIIYIDGASIQDSDIYKVFPLLYKKKQTGQLPGFQELIQKLKEMNLEHLVKNKKQELIKIKNHRIDTQTTSKNWYFLN